MPTPPPDPEPEPAAEEQRVIDCVLQGAVPLQLSVPPGDDAAVLSDGTAITTDMLVESVHFDHRLSPEDVGWKAVAVSVSDLGAMGARPSWMVLDLSLPRPLDSAWVQAFAQGMRRAAHTWSVALIGGDTTASPGPRVVSVTMAGACVGRPLTRASGLVGDRVWVTGTPGLAATAYTLPLPGPAGLAALRRPHPPLHLALSLPALPDVHAAMDLSDGLAVDLPRLCRAASLAACVDADALPTHPEVPTVLHLTGGDDYGLLISAAPDFDFKRHAADFGVEAHAIGVLESGHGCRLVDGRAWPAPSFQHFGALA